MDQCIFLDSLSFGQSKDYNEALGIPKVE
jgi:hypothetical protein